MHHKSNFLHFALTASGMYFNFERRVIATFKPNMGKAVTGLREVKTMDELVAENTGLVCAWDMAAE